ncbi:Metabotropic Glutamate Receptor 1 [Manis pentadactyla]|nr:Metabotropic Glutamate Receptor 1 [Manis pentadactyla]
MLTLWIGPGLKGNGQNELQDYGEDTDIDDGGGPVNGPVLLEIKAFISRLQLGKSDIHGMVCSRPQVRTQARIIMLRYSRRGDDSSQWLYSDEDEGHIHLHRHGVYREASVLMC